MSVRQGTKRHGAVLLLITIMTASYQSGSGQSGTVGRFEGRTDIGAPERKGSAEYDAAESRYLVTGGGENMWGSGDAFHFVWSLVAGDLDLTADIAIKSAAGNPHRKAGWMVRQSLDPDSPYADAVVHADGLISLQYRLKAGGPTFEAQAAVRAPAAIKLQRDGDVFTLSVSRGSGFFQPAASVSVALKDPVYAGLAVCAHDAGASASASFARVKLESHEVIPGRDRVLESTLETIDAASGERKVVLRLMDHFEAPNWSRDGKSLLYNSKGRLFTVPVSGGPPREIDTGFAVRCNNDHGYSPDGKWLAISHSPEKRSLIYILPAQGGTPRLVTPIGPSYWHGWSPDGLRLAYCAERGGNYDIYTIPVAGGEEHRLTQAPGLDDGPDYSPDGSHIYFNSERSGLMQIWRMGADGSSQEQVTNDPEWADWFPHPSPDGRFLAFISYDKTVKGHPANKDVCLRLMPTTGGKPRTLTTLFGGQGTINVPSWSPDSRQFAFVSYRLVQP